MDPVIWLIVVIGIIVAFVLFLILHNKHGEPTPRKIQEPIVVKQYTRKPTKKKTAKKVVKKKK